MQVKQNKLMKSKVKKLTIPFNGVNQPVCFEKGIAIIDLKNDESGEMAEKLAKLLVSTFNFLEFVEEKPANESKSTGKK